MKIQNSTSPKGDSQLLTTAEIKSLGDRSQRGKLEGKDMQCTNENTGDARQAKELLHAMSRSMPQTS